MPVPLRVSNVRGALGPYCPLHQPHRPTYIHVVYPLAHGSIVENGKARAMTEEELQVMNDRLCPGLEHSFTVD